MDKNAFLIELSESDRTDFGRVELRDNLTDLLFEYVRLRPCTFGPVSGETAWQVAEAGKRRTGRV